MGSQCSNSFVRQYKSSGSNGIMMSDIRIVMDSDSDLELEDQKDIDIEDERSKVSA